MGDLATLLQAQQLVELLAVVSSYPDEASATQGAVERAAQALEAEVAAVLLGGLVVTCVGYPAGAVPEHDLVEVAEGGRRTLDVPGAGTCHAVAVRLDGTARGHLLLARSGATGFTVEEVNLVRGMARLLELTLQMLRTLDAERAMRERSERHAAENAQLLSSLMQRQRLMEQLYGIQRAISRRVPLPQVLGMILQGAQELVGAEVAGLWLLEPDDPSKALLRASAGLPDGQCQRPWRARVDEAGAVGQAMMRDELVIVPGQANTSPVIRKLTRGLPHTCMATPVHESGKVAGSLIIASYREDHSFSPAEQEMLLAFAEHVSLAVTDAKTLYDMQQAFHDSLTGLASRALFLDRLEHGLVCAERDGSRIALLFVDLDRFKMVNDTLGHAAGDMLLIGVAQRLQEHLRGGDVAARFGGDEFAIMLQNITSPTQATMIADRIIVALGAPFAISGEQVFVNASIGIAFSDSGKCGPGELLRQADMAMYRAKRKSGGRHEVFGGLDMENRFGGYELGTGPRHPIGQIGQISHGPAAGAEG